MIRRRRLWVGVGVGLVVVGVAAAVLLPRWWQASASDAPHFVEEAAAAGLDHAYDGDFYYYVGGGVAVFDCDGDGREDLYIAGGAQPAALFRNQSSVGGALRFSRVPGPATDLKQVVGAYPIDIDGDGRLDLAVLRLGESVLLRGIGDCRFERANERWGYNGGDAWTAAFSATWESQSSLPTLAFGRYLKPSTVETKSYQCDDNELLRPAASGNRYGAPFALSPGYCSLSMLFSDWNRSGHADLRVSNDRQYYRPGGEEQLWHVLPGKAPRLWSRAQGWQPVTIWGMGIASYDLTGDGYPEVYLTSQSDSRLQTLAGGPSQPKYTDIAVARGASAHEPYAGDVEMRSTAWHAEFEDANNDGLMDLFVSKGNVEAQADYAMRDPNDLLLGRADGTFVEGGAEAGLVNFVRGRGAALADLNLDGLLDLVVVNRRVNVSLYRNVGAGTASDPKPMGNWAAIQLQQDGANRDAIGALVEVAAGGRVERREITIGGGHASGQLGWIHFGLGAATAATVTVTWPDGSRSAPMRMAANGFGLVHRGEDAIQPWTFGGG